MCLKYERFPFYDFLYNYVKIRHFGLKQACEENRIPETEGSGRNIFLTRVLRSSELHAELAGLTSF